MRRSGYSGVTLSEYTIILGLVALLCVWALSMLGHSTSNLLSSASKGQNSGDMTKLVNLDFSSGGGGSGSHSGGGNSGGTIPSNNNLNLVESASGGVNVSSAEGNRISIPGAPTSLNESMTTAKTLEQMAELTNDPKLAAVYRDLADKAYFLAVAQASYEVTGTGKDDPALKDLSKLIGQLPGDPTTKIMTSLKGIDNGVAALGVGRADFLNNPDISPKDKQTVLLLLDTTISQSNQQYGNTMLQNPDYKNAISITPPSSDSPEMTEIRNLATTLSVDTPAVKASVDAGVNLDALAK